MLSRPGRAFKNCPVGNFSEVPDCRGGEAGFNDFYCPCYAKLFFYFLCFIYVLSFYVFTLFMSILLIILYFQFTLFMTLFCSICIDIYRCVCVVLSADFHIGRRRPTKIGRRWPTIYRSSAPRFTYPNFGATSLFCLPIIF